MRAAHGNKRYEQPTVPLPLLCRISRGCPAPTSSRQGLHTRVAHFLHSLCGESGTEPAPAIKDHARVRVGYRGLDVPFQNALAEMPCPRNPSGRVFVGLAHVQELNRRAVAKLLE